MNNITRIHLGRTPFTIAINAEKALRHYLEAVEAEAGSEVVKEVELRIAELLTERGITGEKVILIEDVTSLKTQLGDPSEFSDEESPKTKKPSEAVSTEPKRLFRDTEHGILGGVAAGLSAYSGIDVIIIRLIFIFANFAGGFGILTYFILWLVTPEARTPSDRLQMSGKPVTIDGIKEFVSERTNNPKIRAEITRTSGAMGTQLVRLISKIFRWTIGSIFVTVGMAGALCTIVTAIYISLNPITLQGYGALFPANGKELACLLLVTVGMVLLFSLLLCIGLAAFKRKWPLSRKVTQGLLGSMFIIIAIAVPLSIDTAKHTHDRWQAATTTHMRQITPYTRLVVKGDPDNIVRVSYEPATQPQIMVKKVGALDDSGITYEVKEGVLTIDTTAFRAQACRFGCINLESLEIIVQGPQFEEVEVRAGGSFHSTHSLTDSPLVVAADRDSDVYIDNLQASNITVATSPTGGMHRIVIHRAADIAGGNASLISTGQNSFRIDGFNELSYTSQRNCEATQPVLYIQSMPSKLTINNDNFTDRNTLWQARNHHKADVRNCVVVY